MSNVPRTQVYKKPMGPCKDCADRCVNCHANCEMYISWKAECDKAYHEYVNALKGERAVEDYTIRKINKYKRITPMR